MIVLMVESPVVRDCSGRHGGEGVEVKIDPWPNPAAPGVENWLGLRDSKKGRKGRAVVAVEDGRTSGQDGYPMESKGKDTGERGRFVRSERYASSLLGITVSRATRKIALCSGSTISSYYRATVRSKA